ncbi:MAG TPA: STAS domain-containing protein [Pseudolabrys sp.]|nr:STAS domain-containing protein [Pseudolabrys sp.]
MLTVHVSQMRNGDGDIVVAAIGNLINRTADNLWRSLHTVIEQRPVRLLVDLGGLDAMSSVGERLLIDAARMARSHGVALAIYPGTETLRRRFAENGFDRLVPVLPLQGDWCSPGAAE